MKKVLLSLFYAAGFWGSVHVLIAVVESIYRRKLSLINGLRVTKLDVIFGSLTDKPFFFIGGWVAFIITAIVFYKFVHSKNDED